MNDKVYNTSKIESELLHILLVDKMTLTRVHPNLKDYWWTDEARLFLYNKLMEYYSYNKSLITKDLLIYEIEKHFPESEAKIKHDGYIAELNQIYALSPSEPSDVFIGKLEEAALATVVTSISQDVLSAVSSGDIDKASKLFKQGYVDVITKKKSGKIIGLHSEPTEWLEEVKRRKEFPELYSGIKTGMKKFDELTGGLFKAELTIFFGLSGKGKSTVLKNVCSNIRKQGYNVLHVANEENLFQVQSKYHALESKIEYYKFKLGKYDIDEMSKWESYNKDQKAKNGDIYVLEIPNATDATLIEKAVIDLKMKGINIDVICIDYMDLMAPIRKAYSENDEQAKVTNDCKQLAIDCNVPVISATQASTASEKQEIKDRPFLTMSDIYGTKRKAHSANTLVGIVNKTATVAATEKTIEERRLQKIIFCVPKNRDGPIFTFRQILHAEIGWLEEDSEEDSEAEKIEKEAVKMAEDVQVIEKKEDEDSVVLRQKKENQDEIKKVMEKVSGAITSENSSEKLNIAKVEERPITDEEKRAIEMFQEKRKEKSLWERIKEKESSKNA